jgi:hypothetical protein
MPTIKRIKRTVLGEETTFSLKVSSSGRFSTSWPDIMRDRLERLESEYESMDALVKSIDEAVDGVNKQATAVEWILVYRFTPQCSPDSYANGVAKFALLYTMYKKTTTGKEVTYNFISYDVFGGRVRPARWSGEAPVRHEEDAGIPVEGYYVLSNKWEGYYGGREDVASPEKDTVLPLTEENLAFFIAMREKIRLLNDRMTEFLNPDTIAKRIESMGPRLISAASLNTDEGDNNGNQ